MKIAIRSLLVMLVAMVLAPLAAAQMMGMGAHPPSFAGVFNPVVGSGAGYEIVSKNGQKTAVEIAVVDKESGGYWIEMSMQMPEGNGHNPMMNGPSHVKELLVRQGDDLIIQRVIAQMAGQPPVDMGSMAHTMQSQQSKADIRANAQNMGTESVATPAGTFSCQHWRDTKNNDDYWISDKITPWQLVKMTGPNTSTMTLTKLITGAKSQITGAPVSMQEMMQRMQQGMGKQ